MEDQELELGSKLRGRLAVGFEEISLSWLVVRKIRVGRGRRRGC